MEEHVDEEFTVVSDEEQRSPLALTKTSPKHRNEHQEIDSDIKHITAEMLNFALYGKINENDSKAASTAPIDLTVPQEVRMGPSTIPGKTVGVFSTTWIHQGTEMGPLSGQKLQVLDPHRLNGWTWEVLKENGEVDFFLDANDESSRSWLHYVNCARHSNEQNVDLVQNGHLLFYRASKDIPAGQELLVWYSTEHRLYMGLPGVGGPGVIENSPRAKLGAEGGGVASVTRCVLCQRGFNSRSNLRSHMRIHTMERPFACRFCDRRFSQSSTLRNHVRLHTGEKPYKCLICQSAYSQLAGLRAHQKSARHRPRAVTAEKVPNEKGPPCVTV